MIAWHHPHSMYSGKALWYLRSRAFRRILGTLYIEYGRYQRSMKFNSIVVQFVSSCMISNHLYDLSNNPDPSLSQNP
ncbi:hypothetical protein EYC84_003552 [Monilinia fructicola]|uniref:Uncharacterized protein n=1 Tax=Monilinia fructicola TaxID=38448 RepID=A0A5M9JXX6_MONFR|nr:hypothetical protein EYC84_003552 [Monilinia fructicola]